LVGHSRDTCCEMAHKSCSVTHPFSYHPLGNLS
jgi:hypothetical protein